MLFVAWQGLSGASAGQVLGRTYTPTGQALGEISTVSATSATNENAQVAGTANGWIVVWDDTASIKMRVRGEVVHNAAEGNGPLSALDAALRKVLAPARFHPCYRGPRASIEKDRRVDQPSACRGRRPCRRSGRSPGSAGCSAGRSGPGYPAGAECFRVLYWAYKWRASGKEITGILLVCQVEKPFVV